MSSSCYFYYLSRLVSAQMSENTFVRRSRKSAPVKNAFFVRASRRGRSRLRELGNTSAIDEQSRDTSSKSIDEHDSHRDKPQPVRSRRRGQSGASKRGPRMSTPMGRDRSSLGRGRPRTSTHHDESSHSLQDLPTVANRRYHPNYDPYIEIRRARERLAQYKTEGDWEVDAALSEDAEKDLQRYEEKLKRRYSLRSDFTGELDLERRQLELLRRQRDIDMGKTTKKYAEYVLTIPKPERQKHHPRTPNKFRQVSRRAWDGMIRKWRKHLHNYDNPDFNETWRSLATTDVSMSSVTSNASSPSPCTEGGTMLRHPSSQAAGGDAEEAQLSSAPVIVDAWRKTQTSLELEADEDTLQGGGGGQRAPQSGAPAAPGGMSDDDTLQAADVKWNLRGRTVVAVKTGSESHYAPAPDVLHSGLTNDVVGLGVRRDDSTFAAISEMLSPKKRSGGPSGENSSERTRRSSGRLRSLR
uniref:SLBP_RNA_bind domain-containing protein n=1 Tax=Mesocestoides corti TaxID=53468 RepID=A0A5K3F770_MESCO